MNKYLSQRFSDVFRGIKREDWGEKVDFLLEKIDFINASVKTNNQSD